VGARTVPNVVVAIASPFAWDATGHAQKTAAYWPRPEGRGGAGRTPSYTPWRLVVLALPQYTMGVTADAVPQDIPTTPLEDPMYIGLGTLLLIIILILLFA
jgi:hypothetical protein